MLQGPLRSSWLSVGEGPPSVSAPPEDGRCPSLAPLWCGRSHLTWLGDSSAGLGPLFDAVAKVGHVGFFLATDDDPEDREDQPEPAVRSRLEGRMKSCALGCWFELTGKPD